MNLPASAACQLVPQAAMLIFLQRFELGFGDLHLVEEDMAGILRDAAERGVADGARLLVDFLEHEMLEAALFRHDRIPGDVLRFALQRVAVEIGERTPSGVMIARSPSARKKRSRV